MNISKRFVDFQDKKSKTVLINTFYSVFIKGLNVSINFLIVPLMFGFLNSTQYGVWLTLTAVLGWFSLFDLGFGNGLRNHLTIAISTNNVKEGKIYVSTTYAALTVIFGCLILLFIFIHPLINWTSIFNAPESMTADVNLAVLFSIGFLFVQFVVRLINTVLLAYQRAAMADFTNCLVQVFVLFGLYILKIFHINSLTGVAIVYSTVPLLVFLVISLFLFGGIYSDIRPSFSFVKKAYVRSLMKLGLNFFIIQIATLILYASDNFIIAHLFTPGDVTVYNVAFKYFSVSSIFFTIVLSPFWSMTTRAQAEKDWAWIKDAVRKLKYLWIVLLICGLLQIIISKAVYHVWISDSVIIPMQLSIVMFCYFAVTNWCSIYSNFLNGIGRIRLQLFLAVIGMIINIPLAIFLIKKCHFGIIGIPIATISTMIAANIFGMIQYSKIVRNTAVGIWNK